MSRLVTHCRNSCRRENSCTSRLHARASPQTDRSLSHHRLLTSRATRTGNTLNMPKAEKTRGHWSINLSNSVVFSIVIFAYFMSSSREERYPTQARHHRSPTEMGAHSGSYVGPHQGRKTVLPPLTTAIPSSHRLGTLHQSMLTLHPLIEYFIILKACHRVVILPETRPFRMNTFHLNTDNLIGPRAGVSSLNDHAYNL